MNAPVSPAVFEFLYLDPDTGLTVCMIADGAGFRPANASDEINSVELSLIYQAMVPDKVPCVPKGREAEFGELDEFNDLASYLNHYERSYGPQSPSMG